MMEQDQFRVDHLTPNFEVRAVNVVTGTVTSGIGEPYRLHRIVVVRGQIDLELSGPELRSIRLKQGDQPLDLLDVRVEAINSGKNATSIILSGVGY